jgi:hypothetical protein
MTVAYKDGIREVSENYNDRYNIKILKSLMGLESSCLQFYQALKQLMEVAEPQSILSIRNGF